MDADVVINVSHLKKHVAEATGTLHILDDISFVLERSATLAITGSSGSGKSTLLGILAGLDTPSSGEVSLMGKSIFEMDEDARAVLRAQNIGFVFQSFQLLPNLTALENVMLPLELQGQTARVQAQQMLERVGLDSRMHHYPKTLSGGEKQRVALARAFVVTPSILFADEPTGSLDTETGQRIADLMFEMNREKAATLVLVTHDEKLAARCDQTIRLISGRLAATAPDPDLV
ncbi:ABC transporter [Advenella sp. S44]|uniref:ABC transporter ATP-binding protein n=1 Tax=Advenella sp. S44 TaxID=1982755 RepID=UPI000C2A1A9D|nr:ABC transporter ATP-binding protein [Advenella sp. S44]PJX26461.1 ABC transporter [Advenella sp. S44]